MLFNPLQLFRCMKKSFSILGAAGAALGLVSPVAAAVLATVPMQGGMVMPMLMYHADHGHLHVLMPSEIPALTPLLASNPADSFNPADPWFGALDPSAGGAAFSRRYGFMWDSAMSDPLPPHHAVWLRKLASTPGLECYRYSGNAPKAFEPIFGTAGTTNARAWNLMMFHPCFTAPPGTNTHQAVFEAFLVNTNTGQEVPDSGTGPMTFNFTTLPDGRPALQLQSVTNHLAVTWSATATNWVLETAPALNGAAWNTVTNEPVPVGGQTGVVLAPDTPSGFFRLRRQP